MRIWKTFFPLLVLSCLLGRSAAAQETNFPAGPQYLAPPGSILLQSIATPGSDHGSELGLQPGPAVEANFDSGPSYLISTPAPGFLHSIATPSMSFTSGITQPPELATTLPPAVNVDPATVEAVDTVLNERAQLALYSIYYGYPLPNVVELGFGTAAEREATIPASIADSGVVQLTTPQALRERGYGVTVAQAAAWSKAHKIPGRHIYTNEDITKLPSRQ